MASVLEGTCFWCGQLIEQAVLTMRADIKTQVYQRTLALLMQPAWHQHQPQAIGRWCCKAPLMQRRR